MSLRHVILGLLARRPATGYDLKKAMDAELSHVWAADQAGIYRALSALVDAGHAEVERIAQSSRPDRREHRITDPGRAELARWLRDGSGPGPIRDPALVRLVFAAELPADEVVALVYRRIAETRAELRYLTAQAEADDHDTDDPAARRWWLATLDNRRRHAETELAWLRELRDELVEGR